MATFSVQFAAYGALPGGNRGEALAFNVQQQLQRLLEVESGVVSISNSSFGDPANGNLKHFGALVIRDNVPLFFACQENQVIDFNTGGGS